MIGSQNDSVFLTILLVLLSFLSGVMTERLRSRNLLLTVASQSVSAQQVSQGSQNTQDLAKLQNEVMKDKYTFKIQWGNLGKRLVADGVIDKKKLAQAVTGSDTLPQNLDSYLTGSQNSIELTQENAQFWVDVLWGLGLANKNPILEGGPMTNGNNTANFASTAGYIIGATQPMEIYAKHQYITLSQSQQKKVEEIAGGIYRPCCGNSTVFPDCNHGMAALALIELMVSQNFSKEEIYKTVLAFNTYWFPQTYLDIAYHFQKNGRKYSDVSPQELLSKTFSSAMGYQVIHKEVGNIPWPVLQGGGSCGA